LPSLLNDIEAAGFKVDNRYREGFDETIRKPFLMGLRDQLLMRFPDTAILRAFSVLFDPRSYPTQGSELKQYGDEEIKLLSAHFGAVTVSRDPEYFDFVDPDEYDEKMCYVEDTDELSDPMFVASSASSSSSPSSSSSSATASSSSSSSSAIASLNSSSSSATASLNSLGDSSPVDVDADADEDDPLQYFTDVSQPTQHQAIPDAAACERGFAIQADQLQHEWAVFKNYVWRWIEQDEEKQLDHASAAGRKGKPKRTGALRFLESFLSAVDLHAALPNVHKLALVALCIPMNTAEVERGFSLMKRLKTRLRNRLSQLTLSNLMCLKTETHWESWKPDAAVEAWQNQKPRRYAF